MHHRLLPAIPLFLALFRFRPFVLATNLPCSSLMSPLSLSFVGRPPCFGVCVVSERESYLWTILMEELWQALWSCGRLCLPEQRLLSHLMAGPVLMRRESIKKKTFCARLSIRARSSVPLATLLTPSCIDKYEPPASDPCNQGQVATCLSRSSFPPAT